MILWLRFSHRSTIGEISLIVLAYRRKVGRWRRAIAAYRPRRPATPGVFAHEEFAGFGLSRLPEFLPLRSIRKTVALEMTDMLVSAQPLCAFRLTPLPSVSQDMMTLVSTVDSSLQRISKLINEDMALSRRISVVGQFGAVRPAAGGRLD
jgi:hypothetical protein